MTSVGIRKGTALSAVSSRINTVSIGHSNGPLENPKWRGHWRLPPISFTKLPAMSVHYVGKGSSSTSRALR